MATTTNTDHDTIASAPASQELPDRDDNPEFGAGIGRYPRATITPEIRRLSVVSNWRTTATIAFQWAVILGAATLAVKSGHWAVYILAAAIIGSRQQALGILVHDATHYLLYTNRTVNDIVSDLCCGLPIGLSTTLYRSTHIRHHRFTNSEQDPDWVLQQQDPDWRWPKSRREAWWLFMRCALAINTKGAAKAYAVWSPAVHLFDKLSPAYPLRARILFVLSTIAVWAVVIQCGILLPAFLLWVVPGLTLLNITNRMRATAEHILTPTTHELNATRTVIPHPLERVFVSPLNINYHIEHHMFPSVPGRNLGKLHELLMRDPEFRAQAHITHSYFGMDRGLLGELIVRDGQGEQASR